MKASKETIPLILKSLKIPYEAEYKFHPTRRWRFDYAIPEMKVAVEYEGILSSKARHTSVTGFTNDCEKYNQAALLGWKVLRYTALNIHQLQDDLNNHQNNL